MDIQIDLVLLYFVLSLVLSSMLKLNRDLLRCCGFDEDEEIEDEEEKILLLL
jgi:hypothetical protein